MSVASGAVVNSRLSTQAEMNAAKDRFGRSGVEAGGAESLTGCIGSSEQVRANIQMMEDAGVEVLTYRGEELSKGDGGPTCLTRPLLRA